MATHEPPVDHTSPRPGSDRAFGVVVGGILLLISVYLWWFEKTYFLPLGTVAVGLISLGIFYPRSLRRLNLIWTQFGLLLGRIVSPVVLGIVYLTTVVPIGLIMRLCGKDLLSLKLDEGLDTYWVQREPPGPAPASLKDQF